MLLHWCCVILHTVQLFLLIIKRLVFFSGVSRQSSKCGQTSLRSPRDCPQAACQRAPVRQPRQGGQPPQTFPKLTGHPGGKELRGPPVEPSSPERGASTQELQPGHGLSHTGPGAAENQPAATAHGAEEEQRQARFKHPQGEDFKGPLYHL